ncbi:MAG: hypothetical protein K2Q26_06245 [Bdellovibrionales bacterium]|nr:hypothetical protein [Bdellovibrionales bacterium]
MNYKSDNLGMERWFSKFGYTSFMVASIGLLSCTKNLEYQDLRVGDVEFSSLQASKNISQNQVPIETKLNVRSYFSNSEISLALYDSEDCSGEFEEQSQASFDQQHPNPVTPVVPPSHGYTAQTSIQARWNPSVDKLISGLAELPYKIKLYDQTMQQLPQYLV